VVGREDAVDPVPDDPRRLDDDVLALATGAEEESESKPSGPSAPTTAGNVPASGAVAPRPTAMRTFIGRYRRP
jgi:hypothetical protein